ncbi:MAG: NAD(P)-dependent oxidoreductase, partial [Clostridiales bacterium]|nr:NAD(P)-dependent oxidoreductase [Clostridiales bacterium]
AYSVQYGLPVKIARLSQILGVGKGDNRLIAYLCDCARNKNQIVLKSDGKATKAYCYIADCASALITILVNGENTAYNIANESMVLSVRELADFVSKRYIGKDVVIENKQTAIYPKSSYLVMDSAKLRGLGWRPIFGLGEAFDGLVG